MGSSEEGSGASLKRTDLLVGRTFFWAAVKSGAREGSLGWVTVEDGVLVVLLVEVENWEVRSVSWECRRGSWDVIDLDQVR